MLSKVNQGLVASFAKNKSTSVSCTLLHMHNFALSMLQSKIKFRWIKFKIDPLADIGTTKADAFSATTSTWQRKGSMRRARADVLYISNE